MIYLASASQRGFPAPIGPVMYVNRSPPVHSCRKMFLRSPINSADPLNPVR